MARKSGRAVWSAERIVVDDATPTIKAAVTVFSDLVAFLYIVSKFSFQKRIASKLRL